MATIAALNESEATHSRITKDGRKLTYELRVLQQPQRARACGSGAKSSSDRRPVDPPPVIELRVFEGEHRQDITFNHKANFFVYTTLEIARSIALMRGQPVSQPPVLTGSPVSGAALLDRPSPAAYFIFPDLSVRHEGKYRLSFNLFEELKDAKDEDANPSMNSSHQAHGLLGSNPMAPQAHVHFRLEVRSKPFIVYSAKKFPGLSESTSLSRVVAEQGCRVRIRRDVRMRRRDTKSSKDSGEHEEVNGYQSYSEPASADLYRQPSLEQIQSQSQQQPHQSVEQSYYSTPSYSNTNYSQHTQPQYIPQARSSSQQHYHSVHASPVEQSPIQTNAYPQSYSQYPTQTHTRHPSMSSNPDGSQHGSQYGGSQPQQPQQQSYQQPAYNGIQGHQDPAGIGAKSVFWNEQQNTAQTIAVDSYTIPQGQQQHQTPRTATAAEIRAATPNGTHLPPLKSLQPALRSESQPHSKPQTPIQADIHHSSPGSMPDIYGLNTGFNGYNSMNGSVSNIAAHVRSDNGGGGKRGYDRVFDAGRSTGMTNGGRQDAVGQDVPQLMTDEGLITMEDLANMKTLLYRRANGTMQTRRITSPGDQ